MADMTLRVKIKPDTKELDKAISGKKLGLGKGVSGAAPGAGAGELKIAGFGKLLGFVSITAAVLAGLDVILKPIMSLFKVILAILFLPLIPILKPVLKGLGEMARRLAPIMIKMSEKIDKILGPRIQKFVDLVIDTVIRNIDSFANVIISLLGLFESFAPLLDVVLDFIAKTFDFFGENSAKILNVILDVFDWVVSWLEPVWGTVKSILENVIDKVLPKLEDVTVALGNILIDLFNAISNILSKITFGKIDLGQIGRLSVPSVVPLSSQIATGRTPSGPQPFFPTLLKSIININNPIVRNDRDITILANEVGRILNKQANRGFSAR